jgi:Fe2+ transport system protein FeoA
MFSNQVNPAAAATTYPAANDPVTSSPALPLTLATPGEELILVAINGGDALRHRLTELGLVPGVNFRVLQSEGGPLLLAVRDARLAIGRGMAHKILVKIKEWTHG